ncbi:unnamed protein product [Malassezia sympodialis ATCC 42132]|uniref:Similar to S.cerevisiae protein PHR1 (DNA photolyase involved in photoreactivation) n=1 Tax=Malassezia sympodialis (strain ATCC 42132) TaxID=1230383 RepID=M5ECY3_MALS4|nr:uncharacterized protein MSY001_3471 [Malassezia sympodialis ATCC 42132]CCV00765.1 unnamed protein product [Malassezia sympodialis ATCC 42132]SHO79206.1 Similar to S.cerevisiae protein PHR1 (DNA photolyase involved in photoreactivation) [Malassezia sympodialis ATCC 42132]|eukprot:XP_018741938.1 uncharacterized protein MSY001_3471 [Malassezia sympodialis ATCC 42132]
MPVTVAMTIITVLGPCLRTLDNPALYHALRQASQQGGSVIALFVEDPTQRRPGAAFTWWTRKSLPLLRAQLERLHVPLVCLQASYPAVANILVQKKGIEKVYVNRRWGGTTAEQDASFTRILEQADIALQAYTAHTVHEPWDVKTGQGGYYRVYTPFSKKLMSIQPRLLDEPPPQAASSADGEGEALVRACRDSDAVEVLDWDRPAEPFDPAWARNFSWKPGAEQAEHALRTFLEDLLHDYQTNRDLPYEKATSRLSPYLAHGEISPHRVLYETRKTRSQFRSGQNKAAVASADTFERELFWREFNYHLLYHEPDLAERNHNPRFDSFPWEWPAKAPQVQQACQEDTHSRGDEHAALEARAAFECWKSGHTGIPLVDAGMRQLWETGWMHNRVRMVVASVLTKNLRIHWRLGEAWFWDTLVDADPASNPGNWQWVAGTGADAAPFFRIFHPGRQADRFDERCAYVRAWVPELRRESTQSISDRYEKGQADSKYISSALSHPSPASAWTQYLVDPSATENKGALFRRSQVAKPEDDYRSPIVNLKQSRAAALEAYRGPRSDEDRPAKKPKVEK